jgi:hypothetical protein
MTQHESSLIITHGHALLTANQSEFMRVPGLKVLEFPKPILG